MSTVDLLVLPNLDQLLFKLKLYFSFFYKTTYLNEEVKCTDPFPSLRLPWLVYLSQADLSSLV
jgi:hypothetical protein